MILKRVTNSSQKSYYILINPGLPWKTGTTIPTTTNPVCLAIPFGSGRTPIRGTAPWLATRQCQRRPDTRGASAVHLGAAARKNRSAWGLWPPLGCVHGSSGMCHKHGACCIYNDFICVFKKNHSFVKVLNHFKQIPTIPNPFLTSF